MGESRLPAIPVADFNLNPGEPLAGGLRRLSLDQFDLALTGLRGQSVSRDVAIHEMRKAGKRIRALLLMVRPVIGERVFKAENAALRDAARLVSGVRDGAVLVDAVGRMRARYGQLLAPGIFLDLEDRLRRRHQRMLGRVLDDDDALEHVVGELHRARSRYAAWPIDLEDPRFQINRSNRRAIANTFSSIGPGIAATYRDGQKEMKSAIEAPTTEHFHEWRKHVKYLRHQVEIVSPVWPEVVGGLATSLSHLGDVLGDDHDQAELVRLVGSLPDLMPDPDERNLLVALSQQRRRELQGAALVMGKRIYAEAPDRFALRLEAYWSAWSVGSRQ
ncbi:MAG TPA: CHAD domain-containing protein [Acidimicrobiia bacterium]|nr:CHAD domain-containing protein [Acidimicrobiia bacterium]